MNIGIIFYSRTGNTKHAANIIKEKLELKNEKVDLIEIQHEKKPGFFKASRAALKGNELPISNTDFNLKKYDKLIIGAPTWAGNPSPYIMTFFNKAKNYKDKPAAVFYTCGGKTSKTSMVEKLKDYLDSKGLQLSGKNLGLQMGKGIIIAGEDEIDDFIKK